MGASRISGLSNTRLAALAINPAAWRAVSDPLSESGAATIVILDILRMWYNYFTRKSHRTQRGVIINILNVNEPLPPRPPVPNVNIDLPGSARLARRAKRRGRPVRFLFKVALLAALVFAGYWAVQQPFFEPVADEAVSLAKNAFDWIKKIVKGFY
jgi:hypothetical protein